MGTNPKTHMKATIVTIVLLTVLMLSVAYYTLPTARAQGAELSLDKAFYHTGDTVAVNVTDTSANKDALRIETVTVAASSTTDTVGINVTLQETDINTGIFLGSFKIVAPPPGAGQLAVHSGDTITVTYDVYTATAPVDDQAPTVTDLVPVSNAIISDTTPLVGATVADVGPSDIKSAWMTLDGIVRDTSNTAGPLSYQVPDVSPLAEGSHTVVVTAADNAGNENVTSWAFTVDTTKPTAQLSLNVTTPVNARPITVLIAFNQDMSSSPTPTVEANVTLTFTVGDWVDARHINATAVIGDVGNKLCMVSVTAAEDVAGNVMEPANITFFIDTVAPTPPANLTATAVGSSVLLHWDASTDVNGSGVNLYKIYRDGTLVGNVSHPVTDFEDKPYVAGTYAYIVQAVDFAGNTANSTEKTVVFTPPVTSFDIALVKGWNLISLPLIPDNSSTAAVLVDVKADVEVVWSYNAETGKWLMYDPARPEVSDLTTMVDGKGYWLNMSDAATLTVHGVEFLPPPATPPSYAVVAGWNLIGFKELSPMNAEDYLAGVKYVRLWSFVNGGWDLVQPTEQMEPGLGYWIAVTEAGTIYP